MAGVALQAINFRASLQQQARLCNLQVRVKIELLRNEAQSLSEASSPVERSAVCWQNF
jgi:hypothetical protein